ncbi:MAG: flagellar hook-basal body protein [bacterium]|nr:flagellar hook-basal body protein [bacterium]
MVKGIYHSAAALIANQHHLEVVSNNLANANTAGFKEERVSFHETLNSVEIPRHPVTAGEKFVRLESDPSQADAQGTMNETDNPLDVAIIGEGYFTVETPAGVAYTRDGRFQLNAQGELVTNSGYRVLSEGGSVSFPEGNLKIGPAGELFITDPDTPTQRVLDRLKVVAFSDPSALGPWQGGLLVSKQEPQSIQNPRLAVGYYEGSNVNPVSQMVDMIMLARLYEASSKSIQTQDGTLGKAVNDVGRVS